MATDYEKKYKEALERAKKMMESKRKVVVEKQALETIFPELVESEDERIRKEIVDFIRWAIDRGSITKEQREKSDTWFSYLEKQKEQKPAEWSKEDEKMSEGFMHKLEVCDLLTNKEIAWAKHRLNSLHPQPKQEWSEEDEERLNSCISSIEESKENRYAYKETDGDTSYDREVDWLKSLRPSWKPSEEQMKALDKAIPVCMGVVGRDAVAPLESLYEQLKAL